MSRASDLAELDHLLARLSLHARLARVSAKRVPEDGHEAWLTALDELCEVLDLATGLRVRFSKWSDEANGVNE